MSFPRLIRHNIAIAGLIVSMSATMALPSVARAEAFTPTPELAPFTCAEEAPCPTLPAEQTPHLKRAYVKEAKEIWQEWKREYESSFNNGQCTELAHKKRPDILTKVAEVSIAMLLRGHKNPESDNMNWDAQMWDTNAAKAGIPVGATPKAGAIMVFHVPPASYPADPGHVAYVDSVNPDGSVNITEEHAPELWTVGNQTITAAELSGKNIDYIY